MKEFLKKEWKVLLILIIIVVGYFLYQNNKAVPLATIKDTSPQSIASGQLATGKFKSLNDAKEVSNLIQDRVKSTPNVVYMTNTQQDADKKANTIAKKEKADYVLKETTEKNESGKIENKYFGVTQEKNNQLVAGITATDKNVYLTVGYQRDKMEVLIHTKDFKSISGASILYSIKKW